MPGWRRNLAAIWVAQMLAIVGFNARAPFFIFFLRDDLGVHNVRSLTLWSGVLNAIGALTMTIAAPIWGVISDRYGRKPMVVRAMLSGCLLSVLSSFAQAPWHVLVLRAAEGATLGTVSASVAYVASIAPKDRLGFSLGLMQMAVFSGASIGPFVGGFFAAAVGYRHALQLSGSLLGIGALVALFFVHEERGKRPVTAAQRPSFFASTRKHLHNRLLLVLISVPFLEQIANQSIQPIVPLFVQHLVGPDRNAASITGIMLGLGGIAGAVSAIVLGRISDRANPKKILIGCLLVGGVAYFPQGLAPAVATLIIFRMIFGLTTGGVGPTTNALIAETTPPEERGSVYGLLQATTSAGGLVGPLGASAIAAATSLRVPFFITGGVLLLAALWVWRAVPDTLHAQPPVDTPAEPAPATGAPTRAR
jgi:DHA1 family multidrug resistance protein-like MFS transporter